MSAAAGITGDQGRRLLRIYNFYRLALGLALLLVFVNGDTISRSLGTLLPDTFVAVMSVYSIVNLLLVVAGYLSQRALLTSVPFAFAIATGDIMALTSAMYASGGVSSGLAALNIASIAAGSILVGGRAALVLPAVATLAVLYEEFLRALLFPDGPPHYFQGGIYGTLYFMTAFFVRGLAYRLRESEIEAKERALEVADLERLSNLVIQRMQTGIIVATPQGRVRMANGAARLLLGGAGDPTGEGLIPALSRRLSAWRTDPGQRQTAFQLHDSGPDVRASFSAIRTGDDSDVILFLEDQSELQQQAQQLKLAALGRLSASIAHEIRNPLGAISHAAQLLGESTDLDPGDRRLAEIMQNHCRRMNEVIANVLELSRRRLPEPQRLQLAPWLSEFVAEYRESCKAVTIDVQIEPLATEVLIDPGHLRQVLTNHIDNAVRYAQRRTGESRARIVAGVDPLSDRPYLNVIDAGPGVPADRIPSLFEPFFTTEITGTGLGLYISRELCEANQARLSYLPAEPHGSCFRIAFAHPRRAMN